jgi:hypothetical protein
MGSHERLIAIGVVVALALLASYNFVNRSTTETVADVPSQASR